MKLKDAIIWVEDHLQWCHDKTCYVCTQNREAMSAIRMIPTETHDWQCGCGHWNGANLNVCAACQRYPYEPM